MGYASEVAKRLVQQRMTPETVDRRRTEAEVVRNLETTLDGAVVPEPGSVAKLREIAAPVPHD